MLYHILVAVSIFSSLTLFDQITKIIASNIRPSGNVIIKYILEFSYLENKGAAFGMLQGKRLLFLIITILSLFIFGYLLIKVDFKKRRVFTSAIIFLIAGTLGNAIDRIAYGYVVDFIVFPFIDKMLTIMGGSGFVCNMADIYLTFGIILILVDLIILGPLKIKKAKKKNNATLLDDNIIIPTEDEENNEENNT